MKLVIVESPAKAKTIGRFLGKDYIVAASYGHVRDLPGSAEEIPEEFKSKPWARMAVDVENDFKPIYVISEDSKKHIAELKKLLKKADEIVLATDEDREGESISWHLLEILKPKVPVKRIAFHEITQEAIDEALANPRDINLELVRAQESRRVLDRLFGYSLSPVLWKKVRPKLSAGRVQSVAVRLVVEREEERKAFRVAEYWSVDAHLVKDDIEFAVSVIEIDGKRPATGKDFDPDSGDLLPEARDRGDVIHLNEDDAANCAAALKTSFPWTVRSVDQKEARQRPQPPFMTSTLQQAASSLLNFSPRKTMQVAQRLYEGTDLGGGEREGLISYMRTDSLTLSARALEETAMVIRARFGPKFYEEARHYATKSKNAQEAHEAIRPTRLSYAPDGLRAYLDQDELALYTLIWNRTVASQMPDAQLLRTSVDIEVTADGRHVVMRANGSVVVFQGYLKVADVAQKDTQLPPLAVGEKVGPGHSLHLVDIEAEDHFTQPPARFTEASLVRRLEEQGIGRPSTYAPTISTIQQRGYVDHKGKALFPTFLGIAVVSLLRDHFPEYIDFGFTARMEDVLDDISNGEQDALDFLKGFYRGGGEFGHGLEPQIEREMERIEFPALALGKDPETGADLVVRLGKTAPYVQRGEGGEGNTAPIPQDIGYEELTQEKALELIEARAKGNEPIGKHPESGESIYALVGPYGPYVQLGEITEENKKPKRASLPRGSDPGEVDVATAVRLLSLPRELGKHPDTGEPVIATTGRYGPYIKCDTETRTVPAEDDVYAIGFERALKLLAEPKRSRRTSKKVLKTLGTDAETEKAIEVCEGRYGPYVTDGDVNRSLPKDMEPQTITLEQAIELLAKAPKKKKKSKAKAKKKAKSKAKSKSKANTKPKAKARAKAEAQD
ncbi:MAG: type I DNA topoisomerase [Candidatus Hydrogenedentes bacterium]|nr:type I DNA topoisomerase [Candidatus Hydrogenedentota bacterium]